ncbi:MAG: tetratricopeptide repeat protein [Candidatus Rokuibacteriota bacterium]|jgi:tetratricopeptide (TPR) repeat protein/TolB-like protein|nr:tetratricopeptide repeat protein [Patescibacteria group bacterium]
MRDAGRIAGWTIALLVAAALNLPVSEAATKPRAIAVLPFDTSTLERDQQWIGEGVAEVISVGLAQHPAFVSVDEARVRAGQPSVWNEAAVTQAARALRADNAVFGQIVKSGTDLLIQPRLLEVKAAGVDVVALEPITVPEGELLARLVPLPATYARTMKVTLTDAETRRMEKAAQPTRLLKAFELYARAQEAVNTRPGQEGNEQAVDLLARAIEADPNFVLAQYTLGSVHQALGNRWKAAAQFRASTQLDPTYPEPYKALGDLFLAAPRRLFDQAIEAYQKAIDLRPFYADAYVGLGEAKAAKGDVDGAIGAYTKALAANPMNPRVHMSLGKIYYAEKSLYYESVTAYRKAIDLDPRSVEARMGLGEVYEDKGLYKEAMEEYKKVIDLDGKHTGAMYNLALVYEKVDPKEAIAQWERYITLAAQLPSEKDWVDVARQHLKKLKSQVKE